MHLLKMKICKLTVHKLKDHYKWKGCEHAFIYKKIKAIYNLTTGQMREIILH